MKDEKTTREIRIVSYNTEAGGYDRGFDKIAEDIRTFGADLVGLQEIDRYVSRSGCVDQVAILKEKTGLPYAYFTHTIDYMGGEYGTAILSRYPITSFRVLPLSSAGLEGRAIGGGTVSVDGKEFAFFNAHLSYESKEVRAVQFREVAKLLSAFPSFILTGDFNTDDYGEFACIQNAVLSNSDRNKQITFPPARSGIDNIVVSPDFVPGSLTVGPEGHSDHVFFGAVLRYGI